MRRSNTRRSGRRRYPRLTVRVDVELETPAGRARAVATTLGAGGLFVATPEPWLPGTSLIIHLQLPGCSEWLALEARVAWCQVPEGDARSPGMGVEFVDRSARADLAARLERWAEGQPIPIPEES